MDIISNQSKCNKAFLFWAGVLTDNAKLTEYGWIIEGKGIIFTNYGHGDHGEIKTQIMLGFDPDTSSSTVKIVRPNASKADRGPTTVLATDSAGRQYLLREGRLTRNNTSGFIKDKFAELSGLSEVPLMVAGKQSVRHWYVVADLSAEPNEIVAQTSYFSNACARARTLAGGGKLDNSTEMDKHSLTYGMDEKGRITKKIWPSGSVEVQELQGYVYEALKKKIGNDLKKPKGNGYCVDGLIEKANLLIEIKTSISAHFIYEAVGQLQLYPHLIGICGEPEKALLIPDQQALKPAMTAALAAIKISIFTYKISHGDQSPRIEFSDALLERCRHRS